ncbi:glycosyltransferase [Alistipes senegalensis]|uniref:Glycosyltransferase n=1 Tax=Alistipes senegalensis JC50 TaxID=1033732 RepID=A0ABY5V694_9BACT|nr:glycosyltransferase [Alistipes senegalensis]UEA87387.1 glycosyltransferase [Alistipes senegalensis]UWN65022.1 glycosyltransferase [Alistipes senegalensis JC50]
MRLFCGGGKYKPCIFVKNFHKEFSGGPAKVETVQLPQELPFQSEAMAYWIVRHILELSIDILVVSVQPLEYMDMIRKETGNRCKFIYYHHGCPLWEVANDLAVKQCRAEMSGSWLKILEWHLLRKPKETLFRPIARHYKDLCRRVYASTDLYLVLCEEYRRRIERIVRVSPTDSKVRALTNPLTERPVPELQKRKEVLYVGRLSYADKRVDRLLRIWRRVEADFPDWELKIVGDGSERANLERQAVKSGLQRVRFCGHSTCVEVHYATGAILCMTSSFEGWPLVLIEAQAAGVVPIAFACSGGVRRIVGSDRRKGILVAPFDEKQYAAELAALMRDEALRCSMQPAMIASVSDFSLESIGQEWDRMLGELTGE